MKGVLVLCDNSLNSSPLTQASHSVQIMKDPMSKTERPQLPWKRAKWPAPWLIKWISLLQDPLNQTLRNLLPRLASLPQILGYIDLIDSTHTRPTPRRQMTNLMQLGPLYTPTKSRDQCSGLKSSMPFKRNLGLQNIPLSKRTLQNTTPSWKWRHHLKSSIWSTFHKNPQT